MMIIFINMKKQCYYKLIYYNGKIIEVLKIYFIN